MPLFCRHNRLTANCPICSRELQAELKAKAPSSSRPARRGAAPRSSTSRPRGVVTKRLARAADDGYRNALVPGLRATADAERLAAALAAAAARLEPPGPQPEVAEIPDIEAATRAAFDRVAEGLPDRERTVAAYEAWVERAGSQAAAFGGDPSWTAERRFARVFERLALPGFPRAARFELLVVLGAAGRYGLEAGGLHLAAGDDATTEAAKRVLVSGDKLLLERRARDLAEACEVPLAALDRGFAVWGTPGEHADLAADVPAPIRAALSLR